MNTYRILKQDQDIKPYVFGCNYSNPTYVCNYLIRLFPFTQICIEIQVDGFDTPHRLFVSVEKAFKNATSQSTDVREIIPEFLYLPEMFTNINDLNLGKFHDGTPVGDVETPNGNNPYTFISYMKTIFENENISYTINSWIDLIFGYKNKGKEAENAKNLFTEQSYQEDACLSEVKDKNSFLRYGEVGLVPNQLLNTKEFPKKEKIENLKKFSQITDFSGNLKKFRVKQESNNILKAQQEDLLLIGVTYIAPDKIKLLYNNLLMEKRIVYSLFDKEYNEEITEIKKIANIYNKMSKYYTASVQTNKNILIIKGGKLIIIGGFFDGKLLVISTENNISKELSPLNGESPITCINVDEYEKYLFLGNYNGNVIIINIEGNNLNEWKIIAILNNHLKSINTITINRTLNVWISSSIDGYINIYTWPLCKLNRSFLSSNINTNNIFLCDSPIPSIVVVDKKEINVYSINGTKINEQKEEGNIINPIMIKDFMGNDFMAYILDNQEIIIKNIPELIVKARFKNDREIHYLCPGNNNKFLYALNKEGTKIDLILRDTSKSSMDN